jgi:hypothetical protein
MKKKLFKIFLISLSLIVISFIFIGCSNANTELEKEYKIKAYRVDWDKVNLVTSILEDNSDIVQQYVENAMVKENTQISEYRAIEIISYSDTNARFITKTGREEFISADYIEITQIKL